MQEKFNDLGDIRLILANQIKKDTFVKRLAKLGITYVSPPGGGSHFKFMYGEKTLGGIPDNVKDLGGRNLDLAKKIVQSAQSFIEDEIKHFLES